ncbi:hypothetical protein F2P81_004206 [Scophthalmus maximus]|uniref:Uncharacterized protein n=1 Tax=Scophthalmus maximus TaxID=52904 RepID=A0A6A4TD89_SCOMX|nr:hypothetical protein F2P81_004206 [Scophthalmus maximus]
MESSNDYGGIASGSMVLSDGEEENLFSRETAENKTSDDLNAVTTTLPQALPNGETEQPELWNATVSPATQATNSSQVNVTEAEEESQNSTAAPQTSTAHWIAPNATSSPDSSNGTGLQSTTSAPESDATQASTTEPGGDVGSSNSTTPMATTEAPRENETPVTPSSTTAVPPESAETSPLPPASDAPITPEKANKTDKDGAAGSSADRGVASDSHRSSSNSWGAVLGTAVAVALVGLVAYVILKKKQQKAFSHRKLVEEFPSDPVLENRTDTGSWKVDDALMNKHIPNVVICFSRFYMSLNISSKDIRHRSVAPCSLYINHASDSELSVSDVSTLVSPWLLQVTGVDLKGRHQWLFVPRRGQTCCFGDVPAPMLQNSLTVHDCTKTIIFDVQTDVFIGLCKCTLILNMMLVELFGQRHVYRVLHQPFSFNHTQTGVKMDTEITHPIDVQIFNYDDSAAARNPVATPCCRRRIGCRI